MNFELTMPVDMHLHLRDGQMLEKVVLGSAMKYQAAILMPNLVPPIYTVREALEYRKRVQDAIESQVKKIESEVQNFLTTNQKKIIENNKNTTSRDSFINTLQNNEGIEKKQRYTSQIDERVFLAKMTMFIRGLERAKRFQPIMALFLDSGRSSEQVNAIVTANREMIEKAAEESEKGQTFTDRGEKNLKKPPMAVKQRIAGKLTRALPGLVGFKYYPMHGTTHSDRGVKKPEDVFAVLEKMERQCVPLLIHGEVIEQGEDVYDRERRFVSDELPKILKNFPNLKITLEHITTKESVDFIRENAQKHKGGLAASITVHHLLLDRNDMLAFGLKPHYYCKPLLQKSDDRRALLGAARSGEKAFFLGTDSAPHPISAKEASCCAAGVFSAPYSLETLANTFFDEFRDNESGDKDGFCIDQFRIDNFEKFTSLNGLAHYQFCQIPEKITFCSLRDFPDEEGPGIRPWSTFPNKHSQLLQRTWDYFFFSNPSKFDGEKILSDNPSARDRSHLGRDNPKVFSLPINEEWFLW